MALVIVLWGLAAAAVLLCAVVAFTDLAWHDVLVFARGFPDDFVAIVLTVLLPCAVLLLLVAALRRNRASLVVRAFGDGAVDPKEGTALSALVQGRLLEISRENRGARDNYALDFVVADVELLTEESDLDSAVAGVAEVPQLQFAAAVIAFVDSVLPAKRLAAGGELLTPRPDGPGLAMALYDGNGVCAREALWAAEVGGWSPGGPAQPGVYSLAAPAASWLQYEAARAVDSQVELITRSAPSFALLGLGLRRQREGELTDAIDAYVRALGREADNVGALVNLAVLYARLTNDHRSAIRLLLRALRILETRHRESAQ